MTSLSHTCISLSLSNRRLTLSYVRQRVCKIQEGVFYLRAHSPSCFRDLCEQNGSHGYSLVSVLSTEHFICFIYYILIIIILINLYIIYFYYTQIYGGKRCQNNFIIYSTHIYTVYIYINKIKSSKNVCFSHTFTRNNNNFLVMLLLNILYC